ncbi:MAG: hypothetical protein MJ210_04355 [Alphaproteobacteria bacterium]|nr:hypothetical protein [Alphaproteobacteria bacterium]
MNEKQLLDAITSIDETLVSGLANVPNKEKRKMCFKWGTLVVCMVLAAVVGSVAVVIAEENKKYNAAVDFFEENGLYAGELNKKEIKAVYRDITEKKFSYGKTAEVISRAVPGWEIEQRKPTPQEVENVFNHEILENRDDVKGIHCSIDVKTRLDPQKGFDVFEKSRVTYKNGEEILWNVDFSEFYVEDYKMFTKGIAVWGRSEVISSFDTQYGWVALIDYNGKILWKTRLDHGFESEYIAAVIDNENGTFEIIGRGDLKYLSVTCLDDAGNEQNFHKTEIGNQGIYAVTRFGDGYIVQLWNYLLSDRMVLIKINREGKLTDTFSYASEDSYYYISDLIELEGKLYLSGYSVPKPQNDIETIGRCAEINNILDKIITKDGILDVSNEELTALVCENYTAVLLKCDSENGAPENFYSVKGSLGGKLSLNSSGEIEWDVECFVSTFLSPWTSSFTIGGTCEIFRYTFDSSGFLSGPTNTGNTSAYRR